MSWKNESKRIAEFAGSTSCLTVIGPLAKSLPKPSHPTIFVDGGAKLDFRRSGLRVGDGDSSTLDLDVRLPFEKDISDLGFVLQSLPLTVKDIYMIGFLGERRDHEWINLGESHRFLRMRKQTQIFFDESGTFFSSGEFDFEIQGLFSLLTFSPTLIQMTGACRYPLPEAKLIHPLSSHGLSNEGNGFIHFQCDQPALIWKPL